MTRRRSAATAGHPRRLTGDAGASWVGIVVVTAVVALILAGGVLLVTLVVSSLSSPSTLPSVAPAVGTCTGATWFDPETASCVPKAACEADEAYDALTNTCAVPGPTLTGVEPNSGLSTGGTQIRLTGEGFADGAAVSIDGVPATQVTVVSPTSITAITPGSPNLYPVDVEVTNPKGAPSVLDNSFTYVKPPVELLTSITPPRGSTSGGEAVILHGQDFVDGTKVAFGGRAAPSVEVLNAETLRVITPIGERGPVTVNIDLPGQDTYAAEEAFTYVNAVPRVVMAIRPQKGAQSGGTKVTIVGTGFAKGADVAIGGNAARKVKIVSDTKITAVTPPGALGPANVAVRNPGLPAAILADAFEYVEAPTITKVSPKEGSIAGGTKVTIVGTGFLPGATVTFDGQPATTAKVVNPERIDAVSPPGAKGPVDIVVTNKDQPPATAKKAFAYVPEPAAPDAPTELPRCKPITVPAVTGTPGTPLTLTASTLFAGTSGISKPRLASASLAGDTGDDGQIAWQGSPPQITWVPSGTPGGSGTITYRYQAASCTGSALGTISVSAG